MNALPSNVVDFKLPKKPKVAEKDSPPDQRKVSIMPLRALTDKRLHDGTVRVLALICSYTNRAGITWVGQARLGRDMGITKQAISKQFTQLVKYGYIEIIRKGFKGANNNTIRVIFDESIDTETAIAVTSRVEDTRPPFMKERDAAMETDKDGLKKIQDMIKGTIKHVQPPPKTYQMPKGDTITVAKMKAEIAAKKASKARRTDNLEVDYQKPLHSQPIDNLEVDQKPTNVKPIDNLKKIIDRELKINFKDNKLLEVMDNLKLTDDELTMICQMLSDRYKAEGLAVPTNEEQLVGDIVLLYGQTV